MTEDRESKHFDALIVGAGPAGANAALALAHRGRRVALIERAELPRYKTCGGGVVGRALAELPPAARAFEHECRRAELHIDELSFAVEEKTAIVAMAMRADLDAALVGAARAQGAELLAPCTAHGLTQSTQGVVLETSRGRLQAPFLVAADGATSRLAARAGWTSGPSVIPAIEWELRVERERHQRFADAARFDLGVGRGYAWVFPKRAHLSVGLVRMGPGRAPLARTLEAYLQRLGLEAAESVERHGWMIPVRPPAQGVARGRVLLVGDAAGLADPLTGEGIGNALRSGRLAARALLAAGDPARVRAHYERELEREILRELRLAARLARLLYAERLPRWLFRRAGQVLCNALGEVIAGRRTYRELLWNPGNYARLLLRARVGSRAPADG